jgi:hypothetical protein
MEFNQAIGIKPAFLAVAFADAGKARDDVRSKA